MKKKMVVGIITLGLVLMVSSGVFAWWNGGMGHMGMGPGATVNTEVLQNYQKETLPMRDALALKQAELQNEYSKVTPDAGRIASLEKEIYDLQSRLNVAAAKYGAARGNGYMPRGHMMNTGWGMGCGCGMGCW
jgi:hypothetical protein